MQFFQAKQFFSIEFGKTRTKTVFQVAKNLGRTKRKFSGHVQKNFINCNLIARFPAFVICISWIWSIFFLALCCMQSASFSFFWPGLYSYFFVVPLYVEGFPVAFSMAGGALCTKSKIFFGAWGREK